MLAKSELLDEFTERAMRPIVRQADCVPSGEMAELTQLADNLKLVRHDGGFSQ
jgi:hypothetical protein